MANWVDIATAIAGIIDQAPGVGMIRVGEENFFTLAEIMEISMEPADADEFETEQMRVHYWVITRTRILTEKGDLPPQQRWRRHTITLRGYLGEGEGTWNKWQDEVEAVTDKLDGINDIQVTASDSRALDFVSVAAPTVSISKSTFGPYSCHYCEINMVASHRQRVQLTATV